MDFDFEFPKLPSKLGNRARKRARCQKKTKRVNQNVEYAAFAGPIWQKPTLFFTPEVINSMRVDYGKIAKSATTNYYVSTFVIG